MPFSLNDLIAGGVVPIMVAAGLALLLRRWQAGEVSRRLATMVPFVAGFHAGYWLLSLGDVIPISHWHWLPWVLVLSLVDALLRVATQRARGRAKTVRWIGVLLVAVAASWALVPTWEHLEPSRNVHLVAVAAGVVLVTMLLDPLTERLPAPGVLLELVAVLVTESVLLALGGSLRFAQIGGCGAAALIGLVLVATWRRQRDSAEGIALQFGLLAPSLMLVGRVNSFSDVPLLSYLLPPLAPLTLWLLVRGPLADASGVRRGLIWCLPLIVCLLAVGMAVAADLQS